MTQDRKHSWNERIDGMRADRMDSLGYDRKSAHGPMGAGEFDPQSSDYSMPLSVVEHPSVVEAETFFVEARDMDIPAETLRALNEVQNRMRDTFAGFSAIDKEYPEGTYERRPAMAQYIPEVGSGEAPATQNELGDRIVQVAAEDFLAQAKDALGFFALESPAITKAREGRDGSFVQAIPLDTSIAPDEAFAILLAYHDASPAWIRRVFPSLEGFDGTVTFTSYNFGARPSVSVKGHDSSGRMVWARSVKMQTGNPIARTG